MQGCSCLGGRAGGGHLEESVRRDECQRAKRSKTLNLKCLFVTHTGMGMHGSVCLQLSSQFTPSLKERMLGEKGVKERSWSFHWPKKVTMWVYSESLTTPASVVLRMLLDTCRT